jgi:hypothetical protein
VTEAHHCRRAPTEAAIATFLELDPVRARSSRILAFSRDGSSSAQDAIDTCHAARTMSSNYPDPPTTNDAHYTPIYPANPNPNAQLHDGQGPPRGPYPQEPPFPKIENLNDVLQAHALHANHALNDQRGPGHHALPPLAQPQQQKPNRLRKACDSCSIRKVKVRPPRPAARPARGPADVPVR